MRRDKAIALLRNGLTGVKAFNKVVASGTTLPDLSGADLSCVNLSDVDVHKPLFSDADVGTAKRCSADLRGCDLSRADLSNSYLMRVGLGSAYLPGATLTRANLYEADLNLANLAHADLSEVNLTRADLVGADLSHANLRGAALNGANLTRTNLSDANLTSAQLRHAILAETRLSRAVLKGADVRWAFLRDTELAGASFHGAVFGHTTIACDISQVSGLADVVHGYPSFLSLTSAAMFEEEVPLLFLRGCGLPDRLIESILSLRKDDLRDLISCFISYSTKDCVFAERLYGDLQGNGVRCWFAPEDLRTGDKVRQTIEDSIRLQDKLLLIVSASALSSAWVEEEVEAALDLERTAKRLVLCPIRIDESVMESQQAWAASLRRRHIGDFTKWQEPDNYKQALTRLLRDLRTER